ncbi:MAG: PilZ domain-containing protein [Desulforegulaceae bacterium]|jgi:hypothetical protein|nr:PilZ domain-containing protein [Desulforegulaceae bacterium]
MNNERREYPKRPQSVNLVYFAVYNSNNFLKQQGMGKTINISEGGILLETYESVLQDDKIFLSLGLKDETVDIEAKIIHESIKENGIYHTGFSFVIESEKQSESIKKYIELFETTNK